jgi:hypothetical protein
MNKEQMRAQLKEAEFVREVLQDLDALLSIVPKMAEKVLIGLEEASEDQEKLDEAKDLLVDIASHQIEANFRIIHKHAESPIEIIFLASLCMAYSMNDPLSLVFSPPINVERFSASLRSNHAAVLSMWRRFQAVKGDDINGFLDIVRQLPDTDEDTIEHITHHVVNYDMFGLYKSFHLTLQPEIKDIQVKGKNIRPDLYIWLPSNPKFKLIVECDGFQYHSSQSSFSNDRARDRALQRKGFQVFRFSGREIYHNPVDMALELSEYLETLKEEMDDTTEDKEYPHEH